MCNMHHWLRGMDDPADRQVQVWDATCSRSNYHETTSHVATATTITTMMSDSPYNYVRLYNDQDDKTESKIDIPTTATTATKITENAEQQQSSVSTRI